MSEQEIRNWFEGRQLQNNINATPGVTIVDAELFKSTNLNRLESTKSDTYRALLIRHLTDYINACDNA